jgi:hypothetical protein
MKKGHGFSAGIQPIFTIKITIFLRIFPFPGIRQSEPVRIRTILLTLIIYEIFRHKSGTKAVKNESKSKPPLLVNVRFFSFPSGQRVQKAEIGHKKKRTTSFVPLFVPLFACRHFSYIFTVSGTIELKIEGKRRKPS